MPTDVLSSYSSAVDYVSFLSYESYKVESLPPICTCYAVSHYCVCVLMVDGHDPIFPGVGVLS